MKKETLRFGVMTARHVEKIDFYEFYKNFFEFFGQKMVKNFSSSRAEWSKIGQKRPFLIIKTQCERIPSPRGHQLQVIFDDFLVFFHLFFWPTGTH